MAGAVPVLVVLPSRSDTEGAVLRRSTHGPARRSQAPRRATRGPWPRLRYRLNSSRPFASARTAADRGRQAGPICPFISGLAPAGIPSQALAGSPRAGSRPARSGALVPPWGCASVGTAALRSCACGSLHSSAPVAHRGGTSSSGRHDAARHQRSLDARSRRTPRRAGPSPFASANPPASTRAGRGSGRPSAI